ncbi:hypothetical protein E2C01_081329 [Portunus trituberculatus]|uniref:Uncharacterized protein n=1 Tax=Portunus trituberculatus TaxID=210409 RepID=A0A5B7IWC7_PORTR|nr:hypothetical protein [Portunus trituberculatus]
MKTCHSSGEGNTTGTRKQQQHSNTYKNPAQSNTMSITPTGETQDNSAKIKTSTTSTQRAQDHSSNTHDNQLISVAFKTTPWHRNGHECKSATGHQWL